MATTSVTIPIEEIGPYCEQLMQRAVAESRRTLPFVQKAVGAAKYDVSRNFEGAHDPNGSAWPKLEHPRVRTGNDQPLRDWGTLLASMAGKGQGHIENVAPDHFEFGSNLDYAWIHQNGGTINAAPGKMLAIPATREALLYRARDFPRKLVLIAHEGKAPVLMEVTERKGGENEMTLTYYLTPSVTIPQRQFAGFGEPLLKLLDELALDHMQTAWMA